ncbi:MAG: winged helix-turn-helix transcriptional regulator [Thermoplasmata archaeon]
MDLPGRKEQILEFISKNPGYHFRGIQRELRISTGVLQYHIYNLLKEGEIVQREINGTTCFFPSKSFREEQTIVLSHLRNRIRNRILRSLLDGKTKPPGEIKESVKIGSSTLSYHLSLLVADGVVEKVVGKDVVGYRIKNLDVFKGLVLEYRESFTDKLMRDFIELWSR